MRQGRRSINVSNVNNEFVNYMINNIDNDEMRNDMLAVYFRTHHEVPQTQQQVQQRQQQTQRESYQPVMTTINSGLAGLARTLGNLDEVLNASLMEAQQSSHSRPTLTNQQFDSIPTHSYEDIKSNQENTGVTACAICQIDYVDTDQLKLLNCRHYFHTDCIKKWLVDHNLQCPVCRADAVTNVSYSDTSGSDEDIDANISINIMPNIPIDISGINRLSGIDTTPGIRLGNSVGRLLLSAMRFAAGTNHR